jgi:Kef-type K+ transport system membrane component KefB
MTAVTVLLLAAAVGFGMSRLLGIPPIPLLVLSGFGATHLVPLEGDLLRDALLLGVTVIVFVAGIELNPARVGPYLATAVKVGTLQFVVLGALGLAAAFALGFGIPTAGYLALALAASSTLVVVRLLQRRRQLYDPMGRMVTGVLLLQDLFVILLIPVVTGLGSGAGGVAAGVGATVLLVALAGAFLRWIAPRLIPRLADDEESLLLAVLTILFVFLGLSQLLRVPLISGAFLAGLALSPFPVNALVRGQLNSLGDFFSAIFFAALGAVVVIPTPWELLQALVLALVVVAFTPLIVALVSERMGFSARAGIGAGLLLSQTSEFSLIVGIQGLVLAQIDAATFSIIALVTVFTMMLTPLLATDPVISFLTRMHPARRARFDVEPPSGHVLLVGCGTNGTALLEMLVVTPNELWAVDDDPAVVDRVREAGIRVMRGDAADREVLRAAGAERARVVISTIGRLEDNGPLLSLTPNVPVLVRAFSAEDEAWIQRRGGIPVPYSEAAARDFLEWFLEGKASIEDEIPLPPA